MKRKYLDSFLKYLQHAKGYSSNTIRAYGQDLSHFYDYLERGSFDIKIIDSKIIRRYITSLFTLGYSSSTVARKLASIKSFFNWLKKEGKRQDNPASIITAPKQSKKLPNYWPENLVYDLLDRVEPSNPIEIRDFALFDLIYSCGLRISEALNLRLVNIDFYQKTLRILGKGNKQRVIPIPKKAFISLQEYLGKVRPKFINEQNNFVFLSKYGSPLSDTAARKRLRKLLLKSGLAGTGTPHTLRHSLATHLLERGVDIRIVQEILGHSSLSTTQIYTHVDRKKLIEKYSKSHPRS